MTVLPFVQAVQVVLCTENILVQTILINAAKKCLIKIDLIIMTSPAFASTLQAK